MHPEQIQDQKDYNYHYYWKLLKNITLLSSCLLPLLLSPLLTCVSS